MARQDKIKSIPSKDRNDRIAKLKKIWENMKIIMEDTYLQYECKHSAKF